MDVYTYNIYSNKYSNKYSLKYISSTFVSS